MDILKLLTRSTKHTNKASQSLDSQSSKLPSAGEAENPQLFRDVATPSPGKKRKYGDGAIAEENDAASQIPDYFAPKKQRHTPRPLVSAKMYPSPLPAAEKPPSEAECRQILRSHRLKISLLPNQTSQTHKSHKGSKQSTKKYKIATRPRGIRQLTPQPLERFSDLRSIYNISNRLGENLTQQGYKIPTEVQMGSLPLLLDPKVALRSSEGSETDNIWAIDLLAVAPTGSGKTLAFLIPVVNNIIQRRRDKKAKEAHDLEAIVVAPTKELAGQILNEGKKLAFGTGVKIVVMRKGMEILATNNDNKDVNDVSKTACSHVGDHEEDTASLDKDVVKADILVTTPQVLLNTLASRTVPSVRTLVLDEADILLDLLFKDQTMGIWTACNNVGLRVTLWSATMGSNIENLATEIIESRRVRLNISTPSQIIRLVVGLKDSAIPNIAHHLTYAATEPGKLLALRQLLHPVANSNEGIQALRPPFLVFTQTIPRAVALHSELLYDIPISAGGSSRIAVLHSDLSDTARGAVMTRFRNGEIWVLITTDILSRGVDFRGINGVVNYDVPNSGASYIHRVGRTGRAGRDGGVAVTFYTKEDIPYVKSIANIIAVSEKQAGKPASEASVQKWLLDALPTPSKDDKKKLKEFGVEARRGGLTGGKDDKAGRRKMQISTKSGYERRLEHNRKGAIEKSERRKKEARNVELGDEDTEWNGFD